MKRRWSRNKIGSETDARTIIQTPRFWRAGLACLWLALALAASAAPSFSTKLDRSTVVLDETVTLSLVFDGLQPAGRPDITLPDGLEIQSVGTQQQTEFINGKSSFITTYNYLVAPAKPGDFTIPGYRVELGGQIYASKPLVLKVLPRSSQPGSDNRDKTAFLQILVPKTTLYAGEAIPVENRLYAQNLRNGEPPRLQSEGFMLGTNAAPQESDTLVNGQQYHVWSFRLSAIAMNPGDLKLGPLNCSVTCEVRTGRMIRDFFWGTRPETATKTFALSADPISMQILPLPATNKPANFSGVVGAYAMNVTAGPTNVAAGDPITLRIQLSGQGSINTLDFPALDLGPEFKVYPPTIKVQITDGLGLAGDKTFEYVVVPQTPDVRLLPSISFSFFDPQAKTYRTLAQPPIGIVVRPAGSTPPPPTLAGGDKEKKNEPVQDIANIRAHPGTLIMPAKPMAVESWFWMLQLVPLLGLAGVWGRRLMVERLARNPKLVRRREVSRFLEKARADLKRHAQAGESEAYHAIVFRTLQELLGERLDVPAQSITEAVVEDSLRPLGMPEETLTLLHAIFQRCDQARYASLSTSSDLYSFLAQVESAIGQIRAFDPAPRSPAVRNGVMAAIFLLTCPPLVYGATDFDHGNEAYAQGKYSAAITNYQAFIQSGRVSAAVCFNLGNAHFKMGQIGRSIAWYRRALELSPRDAEARNNLQFARTRAVNSVPLPTPWWRAWTQILALNEWSWFAGACWWILAGLGVYRLSTVGDRPRSLKSLRWVAMLLIVAATGFGLRLHEHLNLAPAAVCEKETPVRYGPLEESKSAFVLNDGTEVVLTDRQGDWVQLRDGLGRTGWLKRGQVAMAGF